MYVAVNIDDDDDDGFNLDSTMNIWANKLKRKSHHRQSLSLMGTSIVSNSISMADSCLRILIWPILLLSVQWDIVSDYSSSIRSL